MLTETYKIPTLPLVRDWDTTPILKALVNAHRHLATLRGVAQTIPNEMVLISTLSLQEAKASSEIENIITTQDELFKSSTKSDAFTSAAAKEVHRYNDALSLGYEEMQKRGEILSNRIIIAMFQTLKETQEEFRNTLSNTVLRNEQSGKVVYIPPQHPDDILRHMNNFESYLNEETQDDIDPLIKMAILHHQFESIHPFSDGNGRLGRLLSVLYLCKADLLDIPILYISRFITQNKDRYYHLLQHTRDTGEWQEWVLFILEAVETTAKQGTNLIRGIRDAMAEYKSELRNKHPKIYSQGLLNNLFRHPYTRIDYVMDELTVSRPTATRYLNKLAESSLIEAIQVGQNKYYINTRLVDLLSDD